MAREAEDEDAVWSELEAQATARTLKRERMRHPKLKVDGAGLKTVALNRRYNYEAPSKRP